MLLGCIADDFTGAGDLANTLTREGMRTRLFTRPEAVKDGCEAGVVALKTRSVPAGEAVARSLAALARLRAAGCRQIVFKYCSTFDSTPAGNIGPVAEALADALGARSVVVCPAYPANGRTIYQGHLFVHDRLLSEAGMERHPLTPMTDPDIRRWLARQSRLAPGLVDLATVRAGPAAIAAALAASDATLVVVDATSETDLRAIGAAAADSPLVTGGSGVALGLPEAFRRAGLLTGAPGRFAGVAGPAVVLSGSCSRASREQVARYAANHPALAIDPERLVAGKPVAAEAAAFIADHLSAGPLLYSTAEPAIVANLQERRGAGNVASAVEQLFGYLARAAVAAGAGRLVVAGGETSGAVIEALAPDALDIGPEIDPGVPALVAEVAGRPLALALKSGNFGGPDVLARAAAVLGGAA